MRTRTILLMGCLLAFPVASGPRQRPRSARACRWWPRLRPATRPRRVAPRSHAQPARPAKPHEAPAAAPANATPRKLQDIHIEGEIPVPQVLFITARDQRRFVDFQQRRYLQDESGAGRADELPIADFLVGSVSREARKETP